MKVAVASLPYRLAFGVTLCGALAWNIPATWVAQRLAQWSGQKVLMVNAVGTLWEGSSDLVLANDARSLARFPGRMHWRLGLRPEGVRFSLESRDQEQVMARVAGKLGWRNWHLDPGQASLPAEVLTGLGAPFNTLGLGGILKLDWGSMDWRYGEVVPLSLATLKLEAGPLRSRLSPVAPLGQYALNMAWGPLGGKIDLETISGPLRLSGQGSVANGRFGFDGEATSSEAMEPQLVGLLSILGKRDGAVTRLHY